MRKSIFVVSDLHLGGAPAGNGSPDFQICSPAGQALLAEFVRWVADQHTTTQRTHLVLAGDIVDFLAEREFSAFCSDDSLAEEKLDHIMERTAPFWNNLRSLLERGASLTFQLGNHDLELSLPRCRRLLRDRLGPGDFDFIYDNQAFTEGPVLIEHGNRYDAWNVVPHDTLREIRSALSRGEEPREFAGVPGSRMVIEVMNELKSEYAFVDLLKPENEAVLPLLAVLDPASLSAINKVAKFAVLKNLNRFAEDGVPVDNGNIATLQEVAAEETESQKEMLALARELAYGGDVGNISAMDTASHFLARIRGAANAAVRDAQITSLYRAFRAWAGAHARAFDVAHEGDEYLKPARATAKRGYKVIVYGHTHLVKRVRLDQGAVYLNSGTWADLMKVPQSILTGSDEAQARKDLENFTADLLANRVAQWRQTIPAFARIDMQSGNVEKADVYFFDGYDKVERVPDGQIAKLVY